MPTRDELLALAKRLEAELARARAALSDLVELADIDPDDLPEHIRAELPECERKDRGGFS